MAGIETAVVTKRSENSNPQLTNSSEKRVKKTKTNLQA